MNRRAPKANSPSLSDAAAKCIFLRGAFGGAVIQGDTAPKAAIVDGDTEKPMRFQRGIRVTLPVRFQRAPCRYSNAGAPGLRMATTMRESCRRWCPIGIHTSCMPSATRENRAIRPARD